MKHIAVVDDESAIRENLSYALEKEEYRVSTYPNGLEALKASVNESSPDLYLLDILMPRMDGLEFCRRLREYNKKTPIIFLSSRDEELDRVLGLESGGDDYMGKPFSVRELLARIKAVLRRASGEGFSDPPLDLGPLQLNPGTYHVSWNAVEVILTLSEFRFLLELARAPGTTQTRSALYKAAFPEDGFVNERAVDSHIKRIRRKFESVGAPNTLLKTVYGLGYCLKLDL